MIIKQFRDELTSQTKYTGSLFQIYPSFQNTHKMVAQRLVAKNKNDSNEDKTNQKIVNDDIKKMQESLFFEYKFNQETFDKLRGNPIVYDTPIQFLHLQSNTFLGCQYEEANVEKHNFQLKLMEFPSQNTFFKLLAVYTHQKRTDKIVYLDDTVLIVCATQYLNKQPFMHLSEKQIRLLPE
eukprot:TRINITY_DN11239_c0_g1_i3.p1 TRINITY_DN11239_c0_g1~~TRINITY_DN11239_c0_g1_i3.p1  ORF type:complete len:181 (-),score=25.27 TRINITY_DN11239_c0_g1_i3:416-958(-)